MCSYPKQYTSNSVPRVRDESITETLQEKVSLRKLDDAPHYFP